MAEQDYQQQASTVTAVKDSVNIKAQKVDILAGNDAYENHSKHTFEQKGLTIAVNAPAIQLVQAGIKTAKSVEKVGESKNDRINAMAAANAAWDAVRMSQMAGEALDATKALANGNPKDANVSVSITYGEQKNTQESSVKGTHANASKINAGGKAMIVATGAKAQSNLNIIGSDVSGLQGTHLFADNDINIKAQSQTHQERSRNQSQGWNAGVAVSYGQNGFALGVTAGGNYGKGYGNGDEQSWLASRVGSDDSHTSIISGKDTAILGSQVMGDSVAVASQNLTVESQQDTMTYKGKQQNISGQVTVGYGFSASGSYNQSNVKADYASVNTQAGIFAGNNGFNVNVQNHTDLTGGLITSSEQAEQSHKNHFTTGTISTSTIQNHANYSGSGFGVGGGISVSGADLGQGKQEDNPRLKDFGGEGGVSKEIGIGYDSDSKNSTTTAGIGTSNITITDKAKQQEVQADTSHIQTTLHTQEALSQKGLAKNFDAEKVQREINLQVEVTQEFDKTRQELKQKLLTQAGTYFIDAQKERKEHGGNETEKSLALEAKGHQFSKMTSYLDTALGALWGSVDGIGLATAQVVAQHADYAQNAATHITAGQVYKIDCSGVKAQFYCKDTERVMDKKDNSQWIGGAKEIYNLSELEKNKDKGNIIISNPGIMNEKSDAFRNAVKQNPQAANNGNLYVVINNPTYESIPGLAELMYAGYDKINDQLGAVLPITNAEKTNVAINSYAKDKGLKLEKSNHSRGGLTESVSLQRTNNMGINNIPIVESRFFGTATNVENYLKQIRKNGYNTKVKQATHQADFVGRPPVILGGNPATGGDCWICYSHSSYYGEVPEKYLKKLDNKGNQIENPEYEHYEKIWGEPQKDKQGNWINLSLPKEVILDENDHIKFKEN